MNSWSNPPPHSVNFWLLPPKILSRNSSPFSFQSLRTLLIILFLPRISRTSLNWLKTISAIPLILTHPERGSSYTVLANLEEDISLSTLILRLQFPMHHSNRVMNSNCVHNLPADICCSSLLIPWISIGMQFIKRPLSNTIRDTHFPINILNTMDFYGLAN